MSSPSGDFIAEIPSQGAEILCVTASASIDRTVMVDKVTPGTIHRPSKVVAVAGGKALNVARAAKQLGVFSGVGTIFGGRAGDWLQGELAKQEIPVVGIRTDSETRTCYSVADSERLLTEFYEPNPPLDVDEWKNFADVIQEAANNAKWTAISGAPPPGVTPAMFCDFVSAIAETKCKVSLDVRDEFLAACFDCDIELVKCNIAEARSAVGAESSVDRNHVLQMLAAKCSARNLVITEGIAGAGARFTDGSEVDSKPATQGSFAVGSGDAFLAGLLVARLGGADWESAMDAGTAVGEANARVPGAGNLGLSDN